MNERPLVVGLYDASFRHLGDASITHGQPLPSILQYVDFPRDPSSCDLLLATSPEFDLPSHPRRALWLAENREFVPHPLVRTLTRYDLVITNDHALLSSLPTRTRYLPHVGTWITGSHDVTKTRMTSMLSDSKRASSGHMMRHLIAHTLPPSDTTYDAFGRLFGLPYLASKLPALAPYRFSIVVEPSDYPHFHSEKIADAFATRTVPLYWSCADLAPLTSLGFDPRGILPFATVSGLAERLATISQCGPDIYDEMLPAIEHNFQRICEVPSTEHHLATLLREYFSL